MRLVRMIKHRWLALLGKSDEVYNDPPYSKDSLPAEWITDKAMDRDVMIFNMGYSKKYEGYLVVVTPIPKTKSN